MNYRSAYFLSRTVVSLFIFIMSYLQSILNDPSRRSESTLSILFNAGDAGDTFQREIFQYLNIHDAINLRVANRRLNQIVRGVPLWQTLDSRGNIVYTRNRPASPFMNSVHNSTLRWLGARCGGARFPGLVPCQTGTLTDIQVKFCTGIPAAMDRNRPRASSCCENVCVLCVVSAANQFRPVEDQEIRQAQQRSMCRQCQLYEARRHPFGYSGCVCRSLLDNGWLCWACRIGVIRRINTRRMGKVSLLSNLHRDRRGRKIVNPNRPSASKPLCPGCARSFVDQNPHRSHVTYCMSCDGVVVKPSRGPNYHPTELVPIRAARASKRIAAKYAAMPPLDFTPIIIPSHW